jgi:hypothetical protein
MHQHIFEYNIHTCSVQMNQRNTQYTIPGHISTKKISFSKYKYSYLATLTPLLQEIYETLFDHLAILLTFDGPR